MSNLTDKQVAGVITLFREHIDAIVQELQDLGYTRAEALHILSLWGPAELRTQVHEASHAA